MTEGLDCTADVVDQLRARADQRLARADERQMSLRVLASVLERVKKLGIDSGKTGQVLCVELVGLAPLAVDEPELSGISDQNRVATLFEQTTHPGRVGPHLDGDLQPLVHGVEALPEGLRCGTQPTLLDDLATSGIQQAQMAVLIPEIQPGCHLWLVAATIRHGPILLPGR